MENNEITEAKLIASGWRKVGNSFYNNGKAITHFDGAFQYWINGQHHVIKTTDEVQYLSRLDIKKA